VVAALTHSPTSYQRAKLIKFSNEGNAAITQNCSLAEGVAISGFCLITSIFSKFPIIIFSITTQLSYVGGGRAKASKKRQMARGILYFFVQNACGGFAAFYLPWGLIYDVSVANMINQTWQTEL